MQLSSSLPNRSPGYFAPAGRTSVRFGNEPETEAQVLIRHQRLLSDLDTSDFHEDRDTLRIEPLDSLAGLYYSKKLPASERLKAIPILFKTLEKLIQEKQQGYAIRSLEKAIIASSQVEGGLDALIRQYRAYPKEDIVKQYTLGIIGYHGTAALDFLLDEAEALPTELFPKAPMFAPYQTSHLPAIKEAFRNQQGDRLGIIMNKLLTRVTSKNPDMAAYARHELDGFAQYYGWRHLLKDNSELKARINGLEKNPAPEIQEWLRTIPKA